MKGGLKIWGVPPLYGQNPQSCNWRPPLSTTTHCHSGHSLISGFIMVFAPAVFWISASQFSGFLCRSFLDFCTAVFLKAERWASRLLRSSGVAQSCVPVHWCGGFSPCTLQGLLFPPSSSTIPTKHSQCTHCILITATLQSAHSRAGLLPSPLSKFSLKGGLKIWGGTPLYGQNPLSCNWRPPLSIHPKSWGS